MLTPMRTQSPELTRQDRAFSRALTIATGVIAALLAGAAYLWLRYGSAVFHEIIVAGLALCF